jgi:hypothetical protein
LIEKRQRLDVGVYTYIFEVYKINGYDTHDIF